MSLDYTWQMSIEEFILLYIVYIFCIVINTQNIDATLLSFQGGHISNLREKMFCHQILVKCCFKSLNAFLYGDKWSGAHPHPA